MKIIIETIGEPAEFTHDYIETKIKDFMYIHGKGLKTFDGKKLELKLTIE